MAAPLYPSFGRRRRAIVVDGDPLFLAAATEWLGAAGYDVEAFESFTPAKSRLRSDPPAVLVTELRLGAFNGLHLVLMARSLDPDLRAVVITAKDDPLLREEAERAGALYALKPVTQELLLSMLGPGQTHEH